MTHVQLFVRSVMQTPWALGVMGFFLVFVPIIGMHLVHKYGWEHWEPFTRHVSGETSQKKSDECANLWREWETLWRKKR